MVRFSNVMSVHKQHPWTKPRAHTRFLLDLRLVVRGKDTQHGRTKDIAEGGLGATIPGEMEIGEVVELELQLSEMTEPLKLKAEVRYRRGFQYGFRFLNATGQQRELIRRVTHALHLAP
ncbi:MAG TPA: PilZ domain-containing protein [Verrucomicrobiae bacterium]|nr:PilZ domain-containing protein [Verrucomicrobiae bacterium]